MITKLFKKVFFIAAMLAIGVMQDCRAGILKKRNKKPKKTHKTSIWAPVAMVCCIISGNLLYKNVRKGDKNNTDT